jgi:hypothetical protein
MCCYDKILVNVAAYVISGCVCVCVCVYIYIYIYMCVCVCVCVVRIKQEHLPRYHKNTLLHCILSFNNS